MKNHTDIELSPNSDTCSVEQCSLEYTSEHNHSGIDIPNHCCSLVQHCVIEYCSVIYTFKEGLKSKGLYSTPTYYII